MDDCECGITKSHLANALEEILLQPRYASFITSSLALSDNYEKGLIDDLEPYSLWCRALAEEIAEKEIKDMIDLIDSENMPIVIRMSLNSLLNGLYHKAR